jgi:hypothetical protein
LKFQFTLGLGPYHSVFPSSGFHLQAGSLIGLERMPGQRFNGEDRFACTPQSVNRIDNAITQHPKPPKAESGALAHLGGFYIRSVPLLLAIWPR